MTRSAFDAAFPTKGKRGGRLDPQLLPTALRRHLQMAKSVWHDKAESELRLLIDVDDGARLPLEMDYLNEWDLNAVADIQDDVYCVGISAPSVTFGMSRSFRQSCSTCSTCSRRRLCLPPEPLRFAGLRV